MNCQRVEPLLAKHLDGRLPEREACRVAIHLDDCPACRRLRDELLALGAELRELTTLSSPLDLERRIADRWALERGGGRQAPSAGSMVSHHWRSPEFRLPAWGFPVTVAALLAVLLFSWRDHHPRSGPSDRLAERSTSVQGSLIPKTGRAPAPTPNPSPEFGGGELESAQDFVPPPLRSGAGARGRGPHLQPASASMTTPQLIRVPRHSANWRTALQSDEWSRIEARVRLVVPVQDDFVQIPFPRLATTSERQIAQAIESYKREAAVVDTRLARDATLAFKATALSDFCDRLRADTGIRLEAGRSVADEKVTLFCTKMPLREVMRQLSRPFGYTWLRSKREGEYRYELVQDLRSQLLEEELRNRDRNAALLALEEEIERYRPYLGLSPNEARARARTAAPGEKKLLEKLADWGWGPIQIYFRLSPQELAALRAGQKLVFSADPKPGQRSLPRDMAQGVLQCVTDTRLVKQGGDYSFAKTSDASFPGALPPAAVPEARAWVDVSLSQSELGQFTLNGGSGFSIVGTRMFRANSSGPYALGMSPAVLRPDNRAANASLARDPALGRRVSVQPHSACGDDKAIRSAGGGVAARRGAGPREATDDRSTPTTGHRPPAPEKKVTSADVLEALHQATGLPIVADYFTHLYPAATVSGRDQPLFDLLNQLADAMRLRWRRDGVWLQFRSTSYYDDRLKEVPNRLLHRWAAARRQRGALTLDEVLEIALLSDNQLDATDMAEGARECFGLAEWGLTRTDFFRPHLRYLAQLTPAQRQEALSDAGLAFARMTLDQQQRFISFAFTTEDDPLDGLEKLAGANLRVEYTQPGWFRWEAPEPEGGRPGNRPVGLSPVRERTRAAALQAAQRINLQVSEAQIMPTELAVTVVYTTGSPRTGFISRVRRATPADAAGWGRRFPGERGGGQGPGKP